MGGVGKYRCDVTNSSSLESPPMWSYCAISTVELQFSSAGNFEEFDE